MSLFAVAVGLVLRLPIAGEGLPESVDRIAVAWRDEAGSELGISEGKATRGVLAVKAPAGATALQICGQVFLSRPMTIRDAVGRGVTVVRAASVEVAGVKAGDGTRLLLAREQGKGYSISSVPGPDARFGPDGRSLLMLPGRYILGADQGRNAPVLLTKAFEATPGPNSEVATISDDARPISLSVKNIAKAAVSGAQILPPEDADAEQALLVSLLSRRAGQTGRDGKADLGAVSTKRPTILRIVAPGYRTGRIAVGPSERADAALLQVVLRPWPDLRVNVSNSVRVDGPVVIERCAEWEYERFACNGGWKAVVEARLIDGVAIAPRMEPGVYSVRLSDPGSSLVRVEVEDDPSGPDVVDVDLPLKEWFLRGETRLADGSPVRASVSVTAVSTRARQSHRLAVVDGEADGSFLARVLAPEGMDVSLHAWADEPLARTPKGTVVQLGAEPPSIDLELDSTGVVVRVLDRETDEPIVGCSVVVQAVREGGSLQMSFQTDAVGRIRMSGLRDSSVKLLPKCQGYASGSGTIVEMAGGERKEVDIRLDRTGVIRLRFENVAGHRLMGVRAFALPPVLWDPPYGTPTTSLGISGPDGELEVEGDKYAGLPLFSLLPESAVSIDRLPSGDSCRNGCDFTVRISPRVPFPGLSVSSAAGRALPPEGIIFRKGTIPITLPLLDEVLSVTGLGVGSLFRGSEGANVVMIPMLFAPGDYEMDYTTRDSSSGKISTLPVGSFRMPSSGPIEARAMAVP